MKRAVILFNLGGPDSLKAVEPFLFNLFFDPAIIKLPKPLRYLLAKFIATKRAPKTQKIYEYIGGKSPLLDLTNTQAKALEILLNQDYSEDQWRCFVSMRYWHPFSDEVVKAVKQYAPHEVILLPLYPQFSTTTTESSFKDWMAAAKKMLPGIPHKSIGCYPVEANFIEAHTRMIQPFLALHSMDDCRILFSAHGLPEKIIESGDPYQWQVEQTVEKVVEKLQLKTEKKLDVAISYQSRVGPLKWIGPSTEAEIARAGSDQKMLILVPIAFVSEHSETLVELDIEYKHLAEQAGVKQYIRIPALGEHPAYIQALKNLTLHASSLPANAITNGEDGRKCPQKFTGCICYDKM